ncbi:hypothetical protein ACFWUU_38290 [Kribbella sp. NPDC058693]|uniref:hypothetical protein n=1 Tax=Kribbella sp. NPDC058693 TaxID=3346602 RepID=UPI0036504DCE
MSESEDVVSARLVAVFDEADATLDWVELSEGPAVVRLARLRQALVAAGFGSLAIAAMTLTVEGGPAVPVVVSRSCREATDLLDDAIGPQLAARWRIDAVADQLSPEGLGIGSEPVSVAVMEQALARIESIIDRAVGALELIAEDDSVLPELRDAAADAVVVFDDLEDLDDVATTPGPVPSQQD